MAGLLARASIWRTVRGRAGGEVERRLRKLKLLFWSRQRREGVCGEYVECREREVGGSWMEQDGAGWGGEAEGLEMLCRASEWTLSCPYF